MNPDTIVELSWRIYPAAAAIAVGTLLASFGAARGIRGIWLPIRDPSKNLTIITGFRLTVIGLAIAGIAAAWAWHILWLLVLSLVIGGEETLESTIHTYALRRGLRLQKEMGASSATTDGANQSRAQAERRARSGLGPQTQTGNRAGLRHVYRGSTRVAG